jgi:CxxC-x17-CxxC domain-containing protein
MDKVCNQCGGKFVITEEDVKFYDKVSPVFDGKKFQIPVPKLCPPCRQHRRLAMRNERSLYHRKCDLTGREIVSIYSPNSPYKVYDQEVWWGDKWDPLEYGKDFDFSKTFAENFRTLYRDVPHMSLYTINCENSYYTNYALEQKNCYLIFGGGKNEDCMYGKFISKCKDCVDCLGIYECENCYQGAGSDNCYGCKFFTHCRNCSSCLMIEECSGCRECIACFGLKMKQYCILNKQYSKEDYEKIAKDFVPLTVSKIEMLREKLAGLKKDLPHVQWHIYSAENCTGEAVYNCENCKWAFDSKDSEDCKFIHFTPKTNDTYDCSFCSPYGTRFCYNVCSTVDLESSMTCFYVWYGTGLRYSMECHHCVDVFGCVGLKMKKNCVFNKQYSKPEYEKLVAKIIGHMQKTGEWGEYFDFETSPFYYNETIAMEYFPLDKNGVLAIGSKWLDEKPEMAREGEYIVPPEDVRDVSEDFCEKVLRCEETGRAYKILPFELQFYKRNGIPIPKKCPDQRHYGRIKLHGSYRLYDRVCAKCGKKIETFYEPSREEIVYCEDCYLKEVY